MPSFRVLCIWPPAVPTYFNAGHHLPLWEVGAFLRREFPDAEVIIVDAGALNMTWKETADLLVSGFNVIAIMNEFDTAEAVSRLVTYARALSPISRIVTFGRVSAVIPHFFARYGVDAVIAQGDFECGAADFVAYVRGEKARTELRGLLMPDGEGWRLVGPGHFLSAEEWAYPPVGELPIEQYARLSARPENRFAALPGKRELTVSVARGCPVGCDFCLVPKYQGLKERRRSVQSVVSHIAAAREQADFDYVSMYAPTFTLRRTWVVAFCEQMLTLGVVWKCCTTVAHLDRDLVALMGASGCVRISVGLETLDADAQALLPSLKRVSDERFEALALWCAEANIELNCFVILGMPKQTPEGVRRTFEYTLGLGVKVRPTAYAPYHLLDASVSEHELLAFFTRHLTAEPTIGLSAQEFYHLELTAELLSRDGRLHKS